MSVSYVRTVFACPMFEVILTASLCVLTKNTTFWCEVSVARHRCPARGAYAYACVPVTTAPWAPGSPTVLIANMPALNNSSKLLCTWAGVISILNPGLTKEMVP